MTGSKSQLKLGKGAAFVKSRLKRLRYENETWEADFRASLKPIMQSATHYVGLVIAQPTGLLRAELQIEQSPTVNDLAKLLPHAMMRSLVEGRYGPRCVHLRGNPKWKPLFLALKEIGIEVIIKPKLLQVEKAYREFMTVMRETCSVGKIKPTTSQKQIEATFPAITKWVNGYGHIEIGDQEGFGFIVRALDYSGQVFEGDKPSTLAEAMSSVLDKCFLNGLTRMRIPPNDNR